MAKTPVEQAQQAESQNKSPLEIAVGTAENFYDFRIRVEKYMRNLIDPRLDYFTGVMSRILPGLNYGGNPEIRRLHIRLSDNNTEEGRDFLSSSLQGKRDKDTGLCLTPIYGEIVEETCMDYLISDRTAETRDKLEAILAEKLALEQKRGGIPPLFFDYAHKQVLKYEKFNKEVKEAKEIDSGQQQTVPKIPTTSPSAKA